MESAKSLFKPFPKPLKPRHLYFGRFHDPDNEEVLDRGFVVWMKQPRSYTGEDVVELHAHGSPLNLRRLLTTVLKTGPRLAEPGEFTKRAFLNDRLDLTQAEAVMDLVTASTERSLHEARRQLMGALSEEVAHILDLLVTLRSRIELNIDFVAEDVPIYAHSDLLPLAEDCKGRLVRLLQSYDTGRILRRGLRTAVVGKPNVGKSSLFNALLRERRAIVHAAPGTTRDLIEETANIDGVPVVLVDTAGVRETNDQCGQPAAEVEHEGMVRTMQMLKNADLALFVLDGSVALDDDDRRIAAECVPQTTMVVVNKNDLPRQIDVGELRARFDTWPWVHVSALSGDGVPVLVEQIAGFVLEQQTGSDVVVTNLRHWEALRGALEALDRAVEAITTQSEPELIAVELQLVSEHLGAIIGTVTTDDVLDRIFSEFCIGK